MHVQLSDRRRDGEESRGGRHGILQEEGIPFAMHGILKETEEKMKEMFGDIFTVEYDRDLFDYIYERESLATLRGKKLHGKRNHINRFKENHDWSYESLNDENALEALTMLMEWKMANEATKQKTPTSMKRSVLQECSDVL